MTVHLPQPTTEQEKILEYVKAGHNVLIVAGAGTGKTTTLLHIYRALLQRELRPNEIVAITFTEKAAGELRERIRSLVTSEPLLGSEGDALLALSDAPIGTIHAFCARLAREFPDLAGLPLDFVIMDESTSAFFEDRVLTRFINTRLSAAPIPEDFLRLLEYKDYRPASVRDLIGAIFRVLRGKHIDAESIRMIYPDVAQGDSARSGESGEDPGENTDVGRTALALVEEFRQFYRKWRFENGYADFEDLLEGAARVVGNQDAARRLAKKYRVVLVDEYQDTDRLQNDIVQSLKNAGAQVILVGDPLQSIYAFRGADVHIFESLIQTAPAREFEVCHLSTNFRSGQSILNFVNASVKRAQRPVYCSRTPRKKRKHIVSPPGSGHPLVPLRNYRDLVAGSSLPDSAVIVFPRGKEARFSLDEAREVEAADLPRQALWISNCFDIPPGKIAVLFRRFTKIGLYMRAMEEAGLRYVAYSGSGLFGTQEVLDLVSLLRWVADPADRISEAAILRSPMCGLDDLSLVAWFQPNLVPGTLLPAGEGSKRADILSRRLTEWRTRALAVSPACFVHEVIQESHYLARLLRLPGGVRRAANVLAFLDRLVQLEKQMAWTFGEMVEFVSRVSREDVGGNVPPLDMEDPDTLKLLTVHAAKGLEFEAVILADTLGSSPSSRTPAVVEPSAALLIEASGKKSDPQFERLSVERDIAEAQENFRLLYVAMTRAKRVLAINWYLSHDRRALDPESPDDFSRLLNLLHRNPHRNEVVLMPENLLHPDSASMVTFVDCLPETEIPERETSRSWEGVDLEARLAEESALKGAGVSFVAIKSEPSGTQRESDRRVGSAVHSALAVWHPSTDPADLARSVSDAFGLSDSEQRRIARILADFSRTEIATWIRNYPCQREVDIFGQAGGRWWSGYADLILFAPDQIRVVDYKLSITDQDLPAFIQQVRIYAVLLQQRYPEKSVQPYLFDLSGARLIPVSADDAVEMD